MLLRAMLLALLACIGLTPFPSASAQKPPQADLIVPAGTIVPLTLVNPIKSRSTKPGDDIRAVVAFPVTVEAKVAIPAGTYVDGTISAPLRKVKHQATPVVSFHLTRLVFANGYSAAINGLQARIQHPAVDSEPAGTEDAEAYTGAHLGNSFVSGQTPTAPPPASLGPSPGVFVGVALGAAAAVIGTGIALSHRAGRNADYIVYDAGWQFEMKLEMPVSLDPGKVSPAATGSVPITVSTPVN